MGDAAPMIRIGNFIPKWVGISVSFSFALVLSLTKSFVLSAHSVGEAHAKHRN
jgi:hypothetical protein